MDDRNKKVSDSVERDIQGAVKMGADAARTAKTLGKAAAHAGDTDYRSGSRSSKGPGNAQKNSPYLVDTCHIFRADYDHVPVCVAYLHLRGCIDLFCGY